MFEDEIPTQQRLDAAIVPSSTYYQNAKPKSDDKRKFNKGRRPTSVTKTRDGTEVSNSVVVEAIKALRNQPNFSNGGGYKKLPHYLKRNFGFEINKKKVYRLCKENGLLLPRKKKPKRIRSPVAINRCITKPFSLWELDIKYCFIHSENRFFYLMAIIDVYLRYIVGYHIGLSCTGNDLAMTIELALLAMKIDGSGLVIRSDNGPQMLSKALLKYFKIHGNCLVHELIPVSTPNKNAHIESFNSIFEIEFLQTRYFRSYVEGYSQTVRFINFYNDERVHSSLKYRTPNEALQLFRSGGELNLKPIKV